MIFLAGCFIIGIVGPISLIVISCTRRCADVAAWGVLTLRIAAGCLFAWGSAGLTKLLFASHVSPYGAFLIGFLGHDLGAIGVGMLFTLYLSGEFPGKAGRKMPQNTSETSGPPSTNERGGEFSTS